MAAKTRDPQTKRLPRVTAPEAAAGPVAGALVGYAVFALLTIVIAALFAGEDFSLPNEEWKSLGFGASVLVGFLLLIGYTYGAFIAGRVGGGGQKGLVLGIAVFAIGVALAAIVGWAISAGTTGDQRENLEGILRAFGAPGSPSDWRDIGTTAGISSVLGMLLGSVTGGLLAERHSAPVARNA